MILQRLTIEDLNVLSVTETEFVMISSQPFSLPGSIDSACVSNYSERSFVFNLTDCYPDIQVTAKLLFLFLKYIY